MTKTAADAIVTLVRALAPPDPPVLWPAGIMPAPLRTADAAAIHGLIRRAYANGYGTVHPDWLDWWEWLIRDPEFDQKLCFLARDETAEAGITGFCLVWTSAFVKDLVVDPAKQGSGIGAALLATAITELRRRGHTSLRLKAHARNEPALRFYRRMGFVAETGG